MEEKRYTVAEVAKMLHFQPNTIRLWLEAGKLRGIKVGWQWRIRESDLHEFVKENQTKEGSDLQQFVKEITEQTKEG